MAKCSLYPDWHWYIDFNRLGVKGFFMEADIPIFIRIAVGAIGSGVLVLNGIAIKDRIAKAKKEHFKEDEK